MRALDDKLIPRLTVNSRPDIFAESFEVCMFEDAFRTYWESKGWYCCLELVNLQTLHPSIADDALVMLIIHLE